MARNPYMWLLYVIAVLVPVCLAAFDCSLFATPEAAMDGGLSLVKEYVAAGDVIFDNE